jgi:hypothetical protein
VVSVARNVDSPIVIINFVIVGPLPAIGMAGGNTRLIRIISASTAAD